MCKKITFVASECQPFFASGGLGDVIGSLPSRIVKEGANELDVTVFLPLYSSMTAGYRNKLVYVGQINVKLSWRIQYCGIYKYENNKISFMTNYNGYTEFEDEYDLPDFVFFEGKDRFEIYKNYSEFHYANGYIKKHEHKKAEWWKGPFFCGWGDQWMLAVEKNKSLMSGWDNEAVAENAEGSIPDMFQMAIDSASEENYREFLKLTEEKNIPFNTIIIDCKWNTNFGTMEVDKKNGLI